MKYFSVPCDFKLQTVDKFCELNGKYGDKKVVEAYGQVTSGTVLNSGRITDVLPHADYRSLEKYVRYSRDRGISFNYTLNPACFGNYEFSLEGIREINRLLGRLSGIGIESLTVTLPSLIELIKASGYDFDIKASAICEITSPSKALFYKKLGAARIVVDPDITRDFARLRNICKVFGDGVEIIANNVCYKNCAYKMFHYCHEAHCIPRNTNQAIKDYYFNRCSMQKSQHVRNPIRLNWIRPEDLKHYSDAGINFFKLQGRQNVLEGDIVKTLEYYFREDFNGNLFDLITIFAPYNAFQPFMDNKKLDGFIDKFVENENFCKDVCVNCNYCEMYARKSMDCEKTAELHKKALEFYQAYDEYTKKIASFSALKPVKKLFEEKEAELDLSGILAGNE